MQRLSDQKNGIIRRHRPLKRWFDEQDRGVGRCGWKADPFCCFTGSEHDLIATPDLLQDFLCKRLIGDKAYDLDALLEDLAARGIDVVIPLRRNRNIQRVFDREAYCD